MAHVLQAKHIKLKEKEVSELLEKFNISLSQLPKMKKEDPALPEEIEIGDVIRIERKINGETTEYYRAVV